MEKGTFLKLRCMRKTETKHLSSGFHLSTGRSLREHSIATRVGAKTLANDGLWHIGSTCSFLTDLFCSVQPSFRFALVDAPPDQIRRLLQHRKKAYIIIVTFSSGEVLDARPAHWIMQQHRMTVQLVTNSHPKHPAELEEDSRSFTRNLIVSSRMRKIDWQRNALQEIMNVPGFVSRVA